jgi:hypothetical protein
MYSRRVTYREVAQQVRRFHRDRLLEAVSAASASIQRADHSGKPRREGDPIQQFTLAAIARIALARPTVHRADEPMTDRQLRELCALVIELDHPDIPETGVLLDPVMRRLMARLAYQQGFFRYDEYGDVMRTLALLVEHDPGIRGLPTAQDWERVLGSRCRTTWESCSPSTSARTCAAPAGSPPPIWPTTPTSAPSVDTTRRRWRS